MRSILSRSRLAAAASVAISSLLLASCQTGADEFLAMGDAAPTGTATKASSAGAYKDPLVVAMASGAESGTGIESAPADAAAIDSPAPALKRAPSPMASAYAEIAEAPPEVIAQQNAKSGEPVAAQPAAADLGALTMQETGVRAGSNSIFATAHNPGVAAGPQDVPSETGSTSTSIVPSDLPVVGVRAASKSLFSPSVQPVPIAEQPPAPLPVAEPVTAAMDEGKPVLHKLSDPRPKRKILALREPVQPAPQAIPQQVQLSEQQLAAMGAVPETQAAEPVQAAAEPVAPKKGWMPSLSGLLSGGSKAKSKAVAP